MAEKMGLSMSYINQLETEKRTPSDAVISLLRILEEKHHVGFDSEPMVLREDTVAYGVKKPKLVKIIGWAHAGDAGVYDETPHDWQETIATDCPKEKIFGVRLDGDSMEPRFSSGDVLILMTEERAYNGCYVVVKFKNDGILMRRIEFTGDRVRLVPLNERYATSDHSFEEFEWIYPVWARVTRLWNR